MSSFLCFRLHSRDFCSRFDISDESRRDDRRKRKTPLFLSLISSSFSLCSVFVFLVQTRTEGFFCHRFVDYRPKHRSFLHSFNLSGSQQNKTLLLVCRMCQNLFAVAHFNKTYLARANTRKFISTICNSM